MKQQKENKNVDLDSIFVFGETLIVGVPASINFIRLPISDNCEYYSGFVL